MSCPNCQGTGFNIVLERKVYCTYPVKHSPEIELRDNEYLIETNLLTNEGIT